MTATTPTETFPTDPTGLPPASRSAPVELSGGETLTLTIAPVAKRLGDATVRMLAYNGSIPGPTVRVRQGSEILVNVTNNGDLDATVHWHGLRLENRYDGVPHETQLPIAVGDSFSYRLAFPDPGLYWYHPHIREDYGQELGLYGNILVEPAEPDYWPPVHREIVLTLDDLLLEDGAIAPFSRTETNYAAMGRFGTVLLVGGDPDLALTAKSGNVVRLYLTNTANTRVFDVRLPGARMKLVGGDSGRVERQQFVEDVLIAPSERAVVDVLFDHAGTFVLEHRTPDRTYPLATVAVSEEQATPSLTADFRILRVAPELAAERQRLESLRSAPPDKILALVAEMDDLTPESGQPVTYVCPMHPEVTGDRPGRCPQCGMKLVPARTAGGPPRPGAPATRVEAHRHGGHGGHGGHGRDGGAAIVGPDSAGPDRIEWEDDMVEVNRQTTTQNMHWSFVDRTAGAPSGAIDWRFTVGQRVKIRLVNEMDSDHPMHHPFHLHGAGRFLVLARDGVADPNLVWKDTVLVRTGEIVDILFDVTNPGRWMAHCHIAEHMQSGMMFSFTVARHPAVTP